MRSGMCTMFGWSPGRRDRLRTGWELPPADLMMKCPFGALEQVHCIHSVLKCSFAAGSQKSISANGKHRSLIDRKSQWASLVPLIHNLSFFNFWFCHYFCVQNRCFWHPLNVIALGAINAQCALLFVAKVPGNHLIWANRRHQLLRITMALLFWLLLGGA